MFKTCNRCGKIHPYNYQCRKYRAYNQYWNEASKLRNNTAWKKLAKTIKEDSHFLCAVCLYQGVYTNEKLSVHHITKIQDAPEKIFDENNLICLCLYHHRLAENGTLDKNFLLSLAKRRNKMANKEGRASIDR